MHFSFHWVCEAVATGFVSFTFMAGWGVQSIGHTIKQWGYQQVWQVLKALFFYDGNTSDLYEDI